MARVLTPQDAHTIVNALVRQITGQNAITATDTSSFVSTGEFLLSQGMENVFNALSILLNRTLIASRPYDAKLTLIQAENESAYASRMRKISFYAQDSDPAGNFNTDLFTNFASGYTAGDNSGASTKSQYEQHPPIPLEMNFGGVSVWQDCYTLYEDAVKFAFTSEAEFNKFVSGYIQEKQNDYQSQKEAWNRLAILNHIAGRYQYSTESPARMNSIINLTSAFNTRYGTSYTSAQLRTTYFKEFMEFFTAVFRQVTKFMTERKAEYHWSPTKTINGVTYDILRHTPYADQRVLVFAPFFYEAKAEVFPEIFHPSYLELGAKYEEVTFWQNPNDRAKVQVKPAITNTSGVQIAGTAQTIPYVLAVIFDKDALMTSYNLESVRVSPLESRKGYRNVWSNIAKNTCDDPTEQSVIMIMAD